MIFTFHPQRSDDTLELRVIGDALHVNGTEFDFSVVEENDTLPPSAIKSSWFTGPVTRKNGHIHVAILLPLGPDAMTNQRFPASSQQDHDGIVDLTSVERARK